MSVHNYASVPKDIAPLYALDLLKAGNFRFINNLRLNRDLLEQVNKTKDGQWPFAAILSCMDSRTSAELIFDQGLGDIFSVRIAGNVISGNVLGSLEYATAVVGSKLILVLGHTNCGAVKGACDNVQLGHITGLLDQIKPAIASEQETLDNRDGMNTKFVNNVAKLNAIHTAEEIVRQSSIISDLIDEGKTGIVPAMYDVNTGMVTFYEANDIINYESAAAELRQPA